MCNECTAFLINPHMSAAEFLGMRTVAGEETTVPRMPAIESDGNDVNPICGCRLKSLCVGCGVCTSCDGCYCGED